MSAAPVRTVPGGLCPAWVVSSTSNAHACKDRGWFTEYHAFQSTAGHLVGNETERVEGIGTVELPVEADGGGRRRSLLKIHNVLHIPTGLCNIISLAGVLAALPGGGCRMGGDDESGIYHGDGRRIACFDTSARVTQLKVCPPRSGARLGPDPLRGAGPFLTLNVTWSAAERQRWDEFKANQVVAADSNSAVPPYTREEKRWLSEHYGGEQRFLTVHGLSIYDEEDREDGRRIARGFMSDAVE